MIFVNTIVILKWIFVGVITMSVSRKETNGKRHLVVVKDLLNPRYVLWSYELPCYISSNDERHLFSRTYTALVEDLYGRSSYMWTQIQFTRAYRSCSKNSQENDLFVKPEKCDFFVTTVE